VERKFGEEEEEIFLHPEIDLYSDIMRRLGTSSLLLPCYLLSTSNLRTGTGTLLQPLALLKPSCQRDFTSPSLFSLPCSV